MKTLVTSPFDFLTDLHILLLFFTVVEGPTSSFECAHQLGKLCQNRHLLVNLIPYNQTDVKDKLRCPSEKHMRQFQDIVTSYNTFCTIRRTMGADIASACGQLVVQKEKESNELTEVDIEDSFTRNSSDTKGRKPKTVVKNLSNVPSTEPKEEETSGYDRFVKPLAIATSISALCFLASAVVFLRQRRRI